MELNQRYFRCALFVALVQVLWAFTTRVGFYKIPYRHPMITACANMIFHEADFSYGIVHEATGNCNGSSTNLINNTINDTQDAYLRKLSTFTIHSPEAERKTVFTVPDLRNMQGVLSLQIEMNHIEFNEFEIEFCEQIAGSDDTSLLWYSRNRENFTGHPPFLFHGKFETADTETNCEFMINDVNWISFEIQTDDTKSWLQVTFEDRTTCMLPSDRLRRYVKLGRPVYAARITYN